MQEPARFATPAYQAVLDRSASAPPCQLPAPLCAEVADHAQAGYPLEVCGLLIGRYDTDGWLVSRVHPVANLNQERAADRFALDPAEYQRVDRELRGSGQEIVGIYHSHPDCPAKPSPTDLENSWEGFLYLIVAVVDGKVAEVNGWALNLAGTAFNQAEIII